VNRAAFEKELTTQITPEVFRVWDADITAHQTFIENNDEYPIWEPTLYEIQEILENFRVSFFDIKQ
jgi:hypothetical protein